MRSRGNGPWISRLITSGLVFLILAGPWIVAAIGGILAARSGGSKAFWAIGAPSPLYLGYMLTLFDGTLSPPEKDQIAIGVACGLLWGLVGLVLLSVAARKAHRIVVAHDTAIAANEAALRAEEEALARAAAESPQAAPFPTDAAPGAAAQGAPLPPDAARVMPPA